VRALVVLPSYNERENIVPLVKAILALGEAYNVCVVDDSSPDGTAGVVEHLRDTELSASDRKRLHLIVRASKSGRGGAVRAGIEWGLALTKEQRFDTFVEMDCDFSHPPSDLPRGLDLLRVADVVMGCRYPDGKIVGWPLYRRGFSLMANLLTRSLIDWGIADYTNGFRFYTAHSASIMCRVPQRHRGYIYLSETIAAFLQQGLRIRCFPIRFVNRQRGKSNTTLHEVISALSGLLQIAWAYRFGSRPPP
jgi:dolichol-phosphate mannosyltransferase